MEKIKYHDNTLPGWGYGPDGTLLDNWDPDKDYGENACCSVYFRIENDGWDCVKQDWKDRVNWSDNGPACPRFFDQTQAVLRRFNIPEGIGGRSEGFPMEHLYIHPQNISGTVSKNSVKLIAEALNACDGISVRWVDVYEDVSPMTEEDFRTLLEGKRGEIETALLEQFKTKRRNLYIVPDYWSGPVRHISDEYHIPRRCARRAGDDRTGYDFVFEVFQALVEAGKIVTAETRNGTGYRTAKRDELRASA